MPIQPKAERNKSRSGDRSYIFALSLHALKHFAGDGDGVARLLAANYGLFFTAKDADEVLQFKAQRLLLFNGNLDLGDGPSRRRRLDPVALYRLLGIINSQVGVGLENAKLADLLF
jgi:hypothetical protein